MYAPYYLYNKKAIVITTINKPNSYIEHYSKQQGWTLIIVGDVKTPKEWYNDVNCIFLGLEEQKRISPKLYDIVPFNSYARKMFGYLYCIQNQYEVIYDTDDDNINLSINSSFNKNSIWSSSEDPINVYKFYTDKKFDGRRLIYPRGFPIQYANCDYNIDQKPYLAGQVSVIQGLVDGDPDIDAKCRIRLNNSNFIFEKNLDTDLILSKHCYCPFNSQNTFWIDKSMFYNLYLPVSVNFRYTDILRGYVALHQLYKNDRYLMFTPPTATQVRNEHNLYKDLLDETEMYDTILSVINILKNNNQLNIQEIYKLLSEKDIVTCQELCVLKVFLAEIDK